jgi:hypothetical protein
MIRSQYSRLRELGRFRFIGVKRVREAIYKIEELKGLNEKRNTNAKLRCSIVPSFFSVQGYNHSLLHCLKCQQLAANGVKYTIKMQGAERQFIQTH